jgi:MFS superfamily sulfate permease-like transporter
MGDFLGQFRMPDFSQITDFKVWGTALTLGLVASVETLLSIEAIDRLDPFRRVSPTNRELMSQGVGNMLSGLIGGIPVTSVIVRSSANVDSGARTKASTILHGVLLMTCAALIPTVLNLIPLSALAAILIATGYKLTKPSIYLQEYKNGWSHFIPLVVTVIAILRTDLLIGILIGLAVGAFFIIFDNYKSAITIVNEEKNYFVRVKKDLSFIHKSEMKSALSNIPDDSSVLIDLSKVGFADLDNVEIIQDFMQNAAYRNIRVELKTLPGQRVARLLPSDNFDLLSKV